MFSGIENEQNLIGINIYPNQIQGTLNISTFNGQGIIAELVQISTGKQIRQITLSGDQKHFEYPSPSEWCLCFKAFRKRRV
jgi:hypothetical protein